MKRTAVKPLQHNGPSFEAVVLSTVDHIRSLVSAHTPSSELKKFLLWLLETTNPQHDDYLQITGVKKMAELCVMLFSDFYDTSLTEKLTPYLGALNAYFFFEVISDNLAIGLSSTPKLSPSAELRREILLYFNQEIQKKLENDGNFTAGLLADKTKAIGAISSFQQSLAPETIKEFSEYYLTQHPNTSIDDLEYSVFSYLILNIEACASIPKQIANLQQADILSKTLRERYAAVSTLLRNSLPLNNSRQVALGEKTILVVPTLLYYLLVLNQLSPNRNFNDDFIKNILLTSLTHAARIVRLSNDLGTLLLNATLAQKTALISKLKSLQQQHPQKTLFELLLNLAQNPEFSQLLARIRKDIKNNESNICLDNLASLSDVAAAIVKFQESILFFSKLNLRTHESLNKSLKQINDHLEEKTSSKLIMRMVRFHEDLYKQEFETNQGEYAIPSSVNKYQ